MTQGVPAHGLDEAERAAIERDRDLAWELFEVRPEHPRIAELAQSVLAREPRFTGMIILLARHRAACGHVEEARSLLEELVGRRDRQLLGALRTLRDLEYDQEDYALARELAEQVLREDPEGDWLDRMELAVALCRDGDPLRGWDLLDEAVAQCAATEPDRLPHALGQRALRQLASGTPPERFLRAAQEAVAADPSEPVLTTALAFALLYDYRAEESEVLLRRVLREDPTDEVAQSGLIIARGFLDPVERGDATMDQLREAGLGEYAWRALRDQLFGTGLGTALETLDAVLPAALAESLRPGLSREDARASGGDMTLISWRDGQVPGTGALWGTGEVARLMTAAEIAAMDAAIEADPAAWPRWRAEEDYYTQILTDDRGTYWIEGSAGRLLRRGPEGPDEVVSASVADWVWDRVAAFGGEDPRPPAWRS